MKKVKLTAGDVAHIAKLANLPLTTKEQAALAKPLGQTLEYVSVLGELATKTVPPTSHVLNLTNRVRPDKMATSLAVDAALANTKEKKNNLFVIPAIFEER